MKTVKFIVEKTSDGYSAYAENWDKYPVGTTGDNLDELKSNIIDAVNSHYEAAGSKEVATAESISLEMDIVQFFEFYKVINATALSSRIKMNEGLIHQYSKGHKKPGRKQIEKILSGLRDLGRELSTIEIA